MPADLDPQGVKIPHKSLDFSYEKNTSCKPFTVFRGVRSLFSKNLIHSAMPSPPFSCRAPLHSIRSTSGSRVEITIGMNAPKLPNQAEIIEIV